MKTHRCIALTMALALALIMMLPEIYAATHYVDINSATPVTPYTTWATAATNIQQAVDASVNGDTILVTNGTYLLSTEITVTKNLQIESVNGPNVTVIDGGGAVRCFSLGSTASLLSGLTITNGSASNGGGIYCTSTDPVVTNCTISGNSATKGGGMYKGTANDCTLSGNSADYGGGAYDGAFNYCTIIGNSAYYGGGMHYGVANNCTISGNTAESGYGGGVYSGTVNNCTIIGNSARSGGGLHYGTARNCTISGNTAIQEGGGIKSGTAINCTIRENSATITGGGMSDGSAYNSIVWYNEAPSGANLSDTSAYYCSSPELSHNTNGNITNAPMLLSDSHIMTNSPCRGAGNPAYSSGTDIDGQIWMNPPSMGCDELHGPGAFTGPIELALSGPTNLVTGYPGLFVATIQGAVTETHTSFDDGETATNLFYIFEHTWATEGDYDVVLTAFNDSYPGGISVTQSVHVGIQEDYAIYVSGTTGDDAADGLSWATAKQTIQAGVDAQGLVGGSVLISNGTYVVTTEISVDKEIHLFGLNGPDTTIVEGGGSNRCFNLGNSPCLLSGLTITNGFTASDGGGIYCSGIIPQITNCTIIGNSAQDYGGGLSGGTANNCTFIGNSAHYGGGMRDGTANNSTFVGNSAGAGAGGGMIGGVANNCTFSGNTASGGGGGGMYYGTANNCTFSGNTASYGGGVDSGTVNNCTISGNSASTRGGGIFHGTANNCIIWYNEAPSGINLSYTSARYCSSPDVVHGVDGNITSAPMLLSASHIATNSPCRAAGNPAYSSGTDIDGQIWLNPPSIGCDELHGTGTYTGPIELEISGSTHLVSGYTGSFVANIKGAITETQIAFGDGETATNLSYVFEHTWDMGGDYDVVLTAFNDSYPGGVSVTQTVHVVSEEISVIHVSGTTGNDAADGLSWATAKQTIQAGVDAQTLVGGKVIISNGTYMVSSEISINKEIRLFGLNGPGTTIIDGGGSNRCFNLGNSPCLLSGLTITNGYTTGSGGGIYCTGIVPVITNCTVSGNSASYGGGIYKVTANHCTISENSANKIGGGMHGSTANHCTISGNSAIQGGGGMAHGTANHCIISKNSANESGGGIYSGTANNCTIIENSAMHDGGGIYAGTANNCVIIENSASRGGGIYFNTANNCTIIGNSAASGGGMAHGTANNSILWYNEGGNLSNTTVHHCSSPGVAHGVDGNITNAPMLLSTSHIATNSPCRAAGNSAYSSGTDIDGQTWLNPPSIGCDELHGPGSYTGPIQLELSGTTLLFAGVTGSFVATIQGAITETQIAFGDGEIVTNSQLSFTHSWATIGDYDVVLTAFNDSYPGGVSVTQTVHVVSDETSAIYVSGTTGNDAADGLSWVTAKQTIQAGIDAQHVVGGMVVVSNGIYVVTTEISVDKGIRLFGLNGPDATIVDGGGSNRCFNLGNSTCLLSGLTITNGFSTSRGGGIYCSGISHEITNCTIIGNSSASDGGGIYRGTVNNCTISGNSASYGGGMAHGTANHCTISENSANKNGGGMSYGTANNCIISGNSAKSGGGMSYGTANNCIISGNSSTYPGIALAGGGGIFGGTANNCTISENTASVGGGMREGTANNCNIVGNAATLSGGGTAGGTVNNSILWYNEAPQSPNLHLRWTRMAYCSSPDVEHGVDGNITNAPMLLSVSHIATNSPCRAAGSPDFSNGTDIDGQIWLNPPSIGCNELYGPGTYTGPIDLALTLPSELCAGYSSSWMASIQGAVTKTVIAFGDGETATNALYFTHSWPMAGDYDVVFTAFNDSYPAGTSITQTVHVVSEEASSIYVSATTGHDAADGLSWATAKQTIQAGVDALHVTGGQVVISNGTYTVSSEIRIDKEIRLLGLNGPDVTFVDGGGSNRCFNLGRSACVVSGLTITNGYTDNGGGIYCINMTPLITNCVFSGNIAGTRGGGILGGTIEGCTLLNNTAHIGGGMAYGKANHCLFKQNIGRQGGGGMYVGSADRCLFDGNSTGGGNYYNGSDYSGGGGMAASTAMSCIFNGNSSAMGGGGASGSSAINCLFIGNSSAGSGGGMVQISGDNYGGVSSPSEAIHCTFIGNTAGGSGGGFTVTKATNCIVWYNTAALDGDNLSRSTFVFHTCSPDVIHGVNGNITNAPMFTSNSHIASNSPCVGAGANLGPGMDIDGDFWNVPPSMGCDEPAETISGFINLDLVGLPDQVAVDFDTHFRANVMGVTSSCDINFGDGQSVTNTLFVTHQWSHPGTYDVVLTAYNTDYPAGISVTQQISVVTEEGGAIYVAVSGSDENSGESWAEAKASIQAGVDAQSTIGGTVWVSNGTYRLSAEINVTKDIQIESVHGPAATIIDGDGAVRCFSLGNTYSRLNGLTISNGYATGWQIGNGGGIHCTSSHPMANHCIIVGNSAEVDGGGMYLGTANNCMIIGNSAYYGGGIASSTANNCTISENNAVYGGGMSGADGWAQWTGTVRNCIIWNNSASSGDDIYYITAYHTCSPDAIHGVNGNTTNAPLFIDEAAGNFRLQTNSPCINWGNNSYVAGTVDLDGNPRIVGGYVDMGAYEYQTDLGGDSDNDGIPDEWERDFFGSNVLPLENADGDPHSNKDEYTAGTDPTNSASFFTAAGTLAEVNGTNCFVVEWMSIPDRLYSVEWTTNLVDGFQTVETNIEHPQNSYTDTAHAAKSNGFYQVEVRLK